MVEVNNIDAAELFCPSDLEETNRKSAEVEPIELVQDNVDTMIDAPTQDSGDTRPKRQPIEPTEREVEEHAMTHCPYRPWCRICVEAQGKEDPHVSIHECSEEILRFSMDYKEMSEYVNERKRIITTLIMREHASTMTAAYVVEAKGSIEQAKRILEFVESFGHDKVSLKSDNEDAIKVLRDEIIHLRKAQIIPAGSVPHHPETHGVAEEAVQDVTAQLRKCKMALESRIKVNINVDEPVIEWMVEHASRIINCHMVGHDGEVPHGRAKYRDPFPT